MISFADENTSPHLMADHACRCPRRLVAAPLEVLQGEVTSLQAALLRQLLHALAPGLASASPSLSEALNADLSSVPACSRALAVLRALHPGHHAAAGGAPSNGGSIHGGAYGGSASVPDTPGSRSSSRAEVPEMQLLQRLQLVSGGRATDEAVESLAARNAELTEQVEDAARSLSGMMRAMAHLERTGQLSAEARCALARRGWV